MLKSKAYYVGIDPGVANYCLVGINKFGKVIYTRMLVNTIKSMSQDNAYMRDRYRRAIFSVLKVLHPRELIVESFTVRGFGTNLIELVNVMIGSLQAYCSVLGIQEHTVMPNSWKHSFAKQFGKEALKKLYDYARTYGIPPHVVDAMCLALYLKGNRSFLGTNKTLLNSNIKIAATLIQPERKIKPKRIKKTKS